MRGGMARLLAVQRPTRLFQRHVLSPSAGIASTLCLPLEMQQPLLPTAPLPLPRLCCTALACLTPPPLQAYHVIPGTVAFSADLAPTTVIDTLAGLPLTIYKRANGVFVEGLDGKRYRVTTADIEAGDAGGCNRLLPLLPHSCGAVLLCGSVLCAWHASSHPRQTPPLRCSPAVLRSGARH